MRVDGRAAPRPADRPPAETRESALAQGEVTEEDLDDVAPRRGADKRPADSQEADSRRADSRSAEDRAASEDAPEERDHPLRHIVRSGQTLYSLARMYGVDLQELIKINKIANPNKVAAGRSVLIPAPASPHPKKGGRGPGDPEEEGNAQGPRRVRLAWPLEGAVTAAYGRRGKHSHHAGLDIDGNSGDPILAAASGTIVRAGVDREYGRLVIIDHGDGVTTLYAHASKLLVKEGEKVRSGEVIAEVGRSGNARGTHLHFEVRKDDRPLDPVPLLRGQQVLTAGAR